MDKTEEMATLISLLSEQEQTNKQKYNIIQFTTLVISIIAMILSIVKAVLL